MKSVDRLVAETTSGNVMSEADDADMDEKFTQVEQERELAGMHERYDAEISRWEEVFK